MLSKLLKDISKCEICKDHLPLGPRPVLSASEKSKLLIIGQAPGTKVHATGIPWNDASGDKLREWLGMEREVFYDNSINAIVPMGFCYPGKGKSGDLPPRPECAPEWHDKLLSLLPNIEISLIIGKYAINYYLPEFADHSIQSILKNFDLRNTKKIPLVHPSPRNRRWLRKNEWFENDYIPQLKDIIHRKILHN